MPHSFGYRARTRSLFSRPFKRHGNPSLSTYLSVFKLGDIVDVKANSAVQKGMPHKFYHGQTGRIWNVSKRAVGVEVNKRVRNRIIKKRIHVRVEHVVKSRSREGFLKMVKENEAAKTAARNGAPKKVLKRSPVQPKEGAIVKMKKTTMEDVVPLKYEFIC